ncbi:MAG: sigma factor-like helix-turn-helix DNA-binding protein [Candidatus Eisenbacteria bacterium]
MLEHEDDHQRVQSILSGSVDAWHQFVHEYAALIHAVIRKHLYGDEDEVQTVFVQVLETLYKQSFATYEGRASLSTWLGVVARGKTLDYLRAKLGRNRVPVAIEQLGDLERKVFQLHFVEGLPIDAVSSRLAGDGQALALEDLLATVDRVETHLDPHVKRRLAYGCRAATIPGMSARLLEYVDHEQLRAEDIHADQQELPIETNGGPDVADLVGRLPQEEHDVLRLRYHENMSAKEAASHLGLSGPRKVYSIADRALARLRRWIDEAGESGPGIEPRESTKEKATTHGKRGQTQ